MPEQRPRLSLELGQWHALKFRFRFVVWGTMVQFSVWSSYPTGFHFRKHQLECHYCSTWFRGSHLGKIPIFPMVLCFHLQNWLSLDAWSAFRPNPVQSDTLRQGPEVWRLSAFSPVESLKNIELNIKQLRANIFHPPGQCAYLALWPHNRCFFLDVSFHVEVELPTPRREAKRSKAFLGRKGDKCFHVLVRKLWNRHEDRKSIPFSDKVRQVLN